MTTEFELRTREGHREGLEEQGIIHWKEIYIEEDDDRKVNDGDMETLKTKIKKQRCLTLEDLILVAKWTRCRNLKMVKKENTEERVKEITAKVLDSKNEKIELLVDNLKGVGWNIASAILHWFAKGKYPIFSAPAIRSCSIHYGNIDDIYNISKIEKFWEKYTEFCREIAAKNKITMRTLDRALWQYSSEIHPIRPKQKKRLNKQK